MAVSQARSRDSAIRYLKGVGPARAALLAQLGIERPEDALYYAPRRYEDRSRLLAIRDLKPGEAASVRAKILAKGVRRARRGLAIVEAAFGDATGVVQAVWFHQPYLAQQLQVGQEFVLYGKPEGRGPRPGSGRGGRLQFAHPELERVDEDGDASLHTGRIVPVYPLTSRLGQRWLRSLIARLLDEFAGQMPEALPQTLRQAHGFSDVATALRQLHFPDSWEALEAAKRRLAYEELLLLQLVLAQRRARMTATSKPHRYQLDGPLTAGVRQALPFTLTASQTRVLAELFEDLARPGPMARLLQGDVGCGKTVLLVFLLAAAVQSGYQAALMAPTELLAEQHAGVVRRYLEPLGVSIGVLASALGPPERKRQLARMASGELSVIIGTHALIQRPVVFARLALAIIDEQHKFGVSQRRALARKGAHPDVLVLTATPIPRTLALSLYGDLDVSTVTELPPGRARIRTMWVGESQRQDAYTLIRSELAQGRQAYVVYPLVEERASPAPPARSGASRELRAATQMAKRLQADVFPELRVGLLHGQMKPAQKERIMRDFVAGTLQLLVSTVIVEVGLDVPNATLMLIEHPERFGLAQLHQLRGRIGRSHHPAACLLMCETQEESVRQRLSAFVETTDGFALAEKDLELRGPGELFGTRQHGWLRFRIASLSRDRDLLELAREDATALVAQQPDLNQPSLAALRQRLGQLQSLRA